MSPANPYTPPSGLGDVPLLAAPPSEPMPLAPRGTRLMAQVLDGSLYLTCAALMWWLVGKPALETTFAERGAALMLMTAPVMALALCQWYLMASTGQSLAKRWLGIRIVMLDGRRVNFFSAVLMRTWLPLVVAAIPYVGLGLWLLDVSWILRGDRRCLHDRLAGTNVVIDTAGGA
jgi:uncharacterized RDD family membrane protein YckC